MKDKIFPSEIIEYTADYHFRHYQNNTLIIYKIIIGIVLLSVFALFIIKIDVSVKGTGILRSKKARTDVRALVSGRVDEVFVEENDRVEKGETLWTIHSSIINEQYKLSKIQLETLENKQRDLQYLIRLCKQNRWGKVPMLSSAEYQEEANLFYQKLTEIKSQYSIIKKDFERTQTLFEVGAIAEMEMDNAELSHDKARANIFISTDQQAATWQAALNRVNKEIRSLESEHSQLADKKDFYMVKAPVTGYIQNIKGIAPGVSISPSDRLAEISPEGGMIAEIMVSSQDIGLLKKGGAVSFQVDSYNYNEWGLLEGEVISISNDAFMDKGSMPYFKVRCRLDKNYLSLKNGYKGYLKKGMTLQARFVLTERTLIQLLFDKADDWVNPNQ
ncbi:HlyD family secretion protein [Echinicola salinicaeni]|uniref:HlyD family secretion protein n=1 Tax=Echinicola salinicaeni TaxID=2762757 RepID=UPI0016451F9F|nr:HlyD family efflux transporter periplasmic adaptor subunit [Echinicola salinicaeni]